MITISVIGTDQVIAYFGRASARQKSGTAAAMKHIGERISEEVRANLTGGMLKERTGKLLRAQELRIEEANDRVSIFVGFDKEEVPYGKFLLEGVPHDWLIEARNKKALRFVIDGHTAFAKRVTHPPLPPHSFLASALAKVQPEIMPTLREAINVE